MILPVLPLCSIWFLILDVFVKLLLVTPVHFIDMCHNPGGLLVCFYSSISHSLTVTAKIFRLETYESEISAFAVTVVGFFWLPSRVGCSMKHVFPVTQTDELDRVTQQINRSKEK